MIVWIIFSVKIKACTESIVNATKKELDRDAYFTRHHVWIIIWLLIWFVFQLSPVGSFCENSMNRVERRLDRNPNLRAQYASFIKTYMDLIHMCLVPQLLPGKC